MPSLGIKGLLIRASRPLQCVCRAADAPSARALGACNGETMCTRTQHEMAKEEVLHKLMVSTEDARLQDKLQNIAWARQIPEQRVYAYLKACPIPLPVAMRDDIFVLYCDLVHPRHKCGTLERIARIIALRAFCVQDLYKLSLPTEVSASRSFCAKMSQMVKQFKDMSELELDTHAAHAAE